jgi:hypothetical protein
MENSRFRLLPQTNSSSASAGRESRAAHHTLSRPISISAVAVTASGDTQSRRFGAILTCTHFGKSTRRLTPVRTSTASARARGAEVVRFVALQHVID